MLPEFNLESQDTFPIKLLSKENFNSFRFIFLPDDISYFSIFSLNFKVNLSLIFKRSSKEILNFSNKRIM